MVSKFHMRKKYPILEQCGTEASAECEYNGKALLVARNCCEALHVGVIYNAYWKTQCFC